MTDMTLFNGAAPPPPDINGAEALPDRRRRPRHGERQIDIVLAHLQSGRSISQEEAEELCQCANISNVVCDLMALGHDIAKAPNRRPGQRSRVRYSMDVNPAAPIDPLAAAPDEESFAPLPPPPATGESQGPGETATAPDPGRPRLRRRAGTMQDKILRHLLAGNSLTQDEAWEKFRCKQLSGVASRLKDDGWPIVTVIGRDIHGRSVTSYCMSETAPGFWEMMESETQSKGPEVPYAVFEPDHAGDATATEQPDTHQEPAIDAATDPPGPSPAQEEPKSATVADLSTVAKPTDVAYHLGPDGPVLRVDDRAYQFTRTQLAYLVSTGTFFLDLDPDPGRAR
jgi:hypothetical protein